MITENCNKKDFIEVLKGLSVVEGFPKEGIVWKGLTIVGDATHPDTGFRVLITKDGDLDNLPYKLMNNGLFITESTYLDYTK